MTKDIGAPSVQKAESRIVADAAIAALAIARKERDEARKKKSALHTSEPHGSKYAAGVLRARAELQVLDLEDAFDDLERTAALALERAEAEEGDELTIVASPAEVAKDLLAMALERDELSERLAQIHVRIQARFGAYATARAALAEARRAVGLPPPRSLGIELGALPSTASVEACLARAQNPVVSADNTRAQRRLQLRTQLRDDVAAMDAELKDAQRKKDEEDFFARTQAERQRLASEARARENAEARARYAADNAALDARVAAVLADSSET